MAISQIDSTGLAAGAVTLGSQVTGTLAVANGGTGLTAVGASGNVLTSDGTNWTSAAPSGGVTSLNGNTGALTGYQVVTSGTFSAATNINIGSLPSGYKTFRILYNWSCNSSNGWNIRVSTDGGSTYITTNSYQYLGGGWNNGSTSIATDGTSGSSLGAITAVYALNNMDAAATGIFVLDIFEYNSAGYTGLNWQGGWRSANTSGYGAGTGQFISTTYVNGIQLYRVGATTTISGSYVVLGAK